MRAETIREKTAALSEALASGRVRPKIGPQGAIAFEGWEDRAGVSDACALRRIMAQGSTQAKLAIARAEMLAGRPVNRQAVNAGIHLHGDTWHEGH